MKKMRFPEARMVSHIDGELGSRKIPAGEYEYELYGNEPYVWYLFGGTRFGLLKSTVEALIVEKMIFEVASPPSPAT